MEDVLVEPDKPLLEKTPEIPEPQSQKDLL
jgi:hypothetical protein